MGQTKKVTFYSHNTSGHGTHKIQVLKDNLDLDCVFAIQENFATDQHQAEDGFDKSKFYLYNNLAVKSTVRKSGRAKKGLQMGISRQADIQSRIFLITDDIKHRLQVQKLIFDKTYTILWFNIYSPNDRQRQSDSNIELDNILTTISTFIKRIKRDDIVICGDLNWDTKRDNSFTRKMKDWVSLNKLDILWDTQGKGNQFFTHRYRVRGGMTKENVLDHFLVSKTLTQKVTNCGQITSSTSPEFGHFPIHMTITLNR